MTDLLEKIWRELDPGTSGGETQPCTFLWELRMGDDLTHRFNPDRKNPDRHKTDVPLIYAEDAYESLKLDPGVWRRNIVLDRFNLHVHKRYPLLLYVSKRLKQTCVIDSIRNCYHALTDSSYREAKSMYTVENLEDVFERMCGVPVGFLEVRAQERTRTCLFKQPSSAVFYAFDYAIQGIKLHLSFACPLASCGFVGVTSRDIHIHLFRRHADQVIYQGYTLNNADKMARIKAKYATLKKVPSQRLRYTRVHFFGGAGITRVKVRLQPNVLEKLHESMSSSSSSSSGSGRGQGGNTNEDPRTRPGEDLGTESNHYFTGFTPEGDEYYQGVQILSNANRHGLMADDPITRTDVVRSVVKDIIGVQLLVSDITSTFQYFGAVKTLVSDVLTALECYTSFRASEHPAPIAQNFPTDVKFPQLKASTAAGYTQTLTKMVLLMLLVANIEDVALADSDGLFVEAVKTGYIPLGHTNYTKERLLGVLNTRLGNLFEFSTTGRAVCKKLYESIMARIKSGVWLSLISEDIEAVKEYVQYRKHNRRARVALKAIIELIQEYRTEIRYILELFHVEMSCVMKVDNNSIFDIGEDPDADVAELFNQAERDAMAEQDEEEDAEEVQNNQDLDNEEEEEEEADDGGGDNDVDDDDDDYGDADYEDAGAHADADAEESDFHIGGLNFNHTAFLRSTALNQDNGEHDQVNNELQNAAFDGYDRRYSPLITSLWFTQLSFTSSTRRLRSSNQRSSHLAHLAGFTKIFYAFSIFLSEGSGIGQSVFPDSTTFIPGGRNSSVLTVGEELRQLLFETKRINKRRIYNAGCKVVAFPDEKKIQLVDFNDHTICLKDFPSLIESLRTKIVAQIAQLLALDTMGGRPVADTPQFWHTVFDNMDPSQFINKEQNVHKDGHRSLWIAQEDCVKKTVQRIIDEFSKQGSRYGITWIKLHTAMLSNMYVLFTLLNCSSNMRSSEIYGVKADGGNQKNFIPGLLFDPTNSTFVMTSTTLKKVTNLRNVSLWFIPQQFLPLMVCVFYLVDKLHSFVLTKMNNGQQLKMVVQMFQGKLFKTGMEPLSLDTFRRRLAVSWFDALGIKTHPDGKKPSYAVVRHSMVSLSRLLDANWTVVAPGRNHGSYRSVYQDMNTADHSHGHGLQTEDTAYIRANFLPVTVLLTVYHISFKKFTTFNNAVYTLSCTAPRPAVQRISHESEEEEQEEEEEEHRQLQYLGRGNSQVSGSGDNVLNIPEGQMISSSELSDVGVDNEVHTIIAPEQHDSPRGVPEDDPVMLVYSSDEEQMPQVKRETIVPASLLKSGFEPASSQEQTFSLLDNDYGSLDNPIDILSSSDEDEDDYDGDDDTLVNSDATKRTVGICFTPRATEMTKRSRRNVDSE